MLAKVTKSLVIGTVALLLVAAMVQAETHWEIQAVDNTGHATHLKEGATLTVVLEGVVLNNPEDMLDPAYDAPAWMGGQWQIYVQGEGGDHAGTACWMGQKYSRMGDVDYTETEWNDELNRLNYDDAHRIRMGDRVRVTGYIKGYNGKTNVNERHCSASGMDFTVEWLDSTPGLPAPEVITLADVKDASNNDIFDDTRLIGGEYYQARLVRINDVSFVDANLWGPDVEMEITDGTGLTLPCRLGMSDVFSDPSNLGGTFDVVGIFNQEEGYTTGYRMWVMGYDGGSDMLGIVPEPASLLLLTLGSLAIFRRRRRSR